MKHTGKSITQNIDTDREILLRASDKDLINTCKTNKYFYNKVCNDLFFKRRLQLVYPDTLRFFDLQKYKNYKQYYLQVVYYISKMKEDYDFNYSEGNFKKQYNILVSSQSANKNIYLRTLLYTAGHNGEVSLIKYAMQKGAPYSKNYFNNILTEASGDGYLNVVKFAIQNGAQIHKENIYPLQVASAKGHLDIVKYLVENGSLIHDKNDVPLLVASERGHLDIVKYLIEKGANIHADNDYALIGAIEGNHLNIVKYLFELGAKYNGERVDLQKNIDYTEMLNYLKDKGVKLNIWKDD